MKWEWKGRRLAPPWMIARRLLALPLLRAAQILVFVFTFLGWGCSEAKSAWNNMD